MPRARFTRRDVFLSLADAGLGLGTCVLAYQLRFEGIVVPAEFRRLYVVTTLVVVPLWVAIAHASGLHRRAAVRPGPSNLEMSFKAASSVGLLLLLGNPLLAHGRISRAWIGLVTFGFVLAGELGRGLMRRARRALVPLGVGLERYALVGDGLAATRLLADLTRASGAPYRVVATTGTTKSAGELATWARALDLDGLVIPDGQLDRRTMAGLATALAGSGIDVLLAPGVSGLELRVASIAMLHGVPLLRAADRHHAAAAIRRRPTGTAPGASRSSAPAASRRTTAGSRRSRRISRSPSSTSACP